MGLFNFLEGQYLKEGSGIYRNAPQKQSAFRRFFSIFGTKFWSLVRANLLYILLSLPLITGGLAAAGLTYITRNAARGKFAYPCADFFSTVRRTWKQALPAGLISLAVNALFGFNIYFYVVQLFFSTAAAPATAWVMLLVNVLGMLFFSFVNYYVYLQIITFSLTLKQIYKNAAMFAIANLYKNLLIFVCLLATVALLGVLPMLVTDYRIWGFVCLVLYVTIYPAYRQLLIQFTIFPFVKKTMIDPYYEAHPEADKTAMRTLNIDIPDEEDNAVFEDTQPL